MDAEPTSDPTPFFSDFKDANFFYEKREGFGAGSGAILMDLDLGGSKTCGSGSGSGSLTLVQNVSVNF